MWKNLFLEAGNDAPQYDSFAQGGWYPHKDGRETPYVSVLFSVLQNWSSDASTRANSYRGEAIYLQSVWTKVYASGSPTQAYTVSRWNQAVLVWDLRKDVRQQDGCQYSYEACSFRGSVRSKSSEEGEK